jgi:hypothetical protein
VRKYRWGDPSDRPIAGTQVAVGLAVAAAHAASSSTQYRTDAVASIRGGPAHVETILDWDILERPMYESG